MSLKYVYQYDIAAFFITITIFLIFILKRRISTRTSKAFSILTINLLISTVTDLLTIYTISYPQKVFVCFHYILNILCLLSYNALPLFFYVCILCATVDEEKKLKWTQTVRLCVPYLISSILIITTPFTHWIIYFDQYGKYINGPLFDILIVIGFLYFIMIIIRSIRCFKMLSRLQIISVLVYTSSTICALIYQLYNPSVLISLFFGSLTILLVYLTLDNPDDYIDKVTSLYNSKAFMLVVKRKILKERKFSLIGIELEGITYINETIGYNNFNKMLKNISSFLTKLCGTKNCYRISGSKIYVIVPINENPDFIAKLIQEKLSKPISAKPIELSLSYKIAILYAANESTTVENISDLMHYTLISPNIKSGIITIADKSLLEKSKRENKLINILKNALNQGKFEVYYQPIYSVKQKRYTTAEALIRLYDTELGFISPEEFIPLAEKNGLILQIGEFVFENVCNFINKNQLWKKGIEYIHVNLSVIQCMQEKLYDQLLTIMDNYHLNYNCIQFEVTESIAVASSEIFISNMNRLIEKNVNFALDDYGTGFSNTSSILKYPFHAVKLDKSIVWDSMKNTKSKKLISHTISMFKDMDITVVAEGIETKEMVELFTQMDCDYFQGYFYSKPIPAEKFLELLK